MTNLNPQYKRVIGLAILSLVLLIIFLSANTYFTLIGIFEDNELAKMQGVARTLALQVDGDIHQDLITQFPKDSISTNDQNPDYYKIHKALSKAMEANEIRTTIYTMVYDSSMAKLCFGVATSAKPFWKHDYRGFPDELLSKYHDGGTLEPYEDKHGVWLSAFEPIKNSKGQVVAILQIDEQFDAFLMDAKKEVLMNILCILMIVGGVSIAVFFLFKSLIKQQVKLDDQRDEVNHFRKELIANVSHDLRTPLASIQGYLETILLKQEKLSKEQTHKYLERSLLNAGKLGHLIDELFELSKLESKERKLNLEPLNIGDLANDIVASNKIIAAKKGIMLKANVPNGMNPVKADIALIDRVLNNLLSNAIKFCSEGDEIELKLHPCEFNKVHVYINDTGPGIAKDDLPHIFNRFYKTEPQNKSGSGLGLAIVKHILELHNSHYEVKSEESKGTTFYFTLDCY